MGKLEMRFDNIHIYVYIYIYMYIYYFLHIYSNNHALKNVMFRLVAEGNHAIKVFNISEDILNEYRKNNIIKHFYTMLLI